jgi:NAD(P)-dependent dehydrogenase (short-subunit alcohol dehydrogenase family)
MDLKLSEKRALVTGSTDGIGEAIAMLLAREGVRVVIHGRSAEKASRVAGAIATAGGKSAIALGDLSNDADADRVATEATAAFGGIDILVNNLGVFPQKAWLETTANDWNDLYNQNVGSMVRMITRLVPAMKENHWGRVIQIASAGGSMPVATMGNYSTTKAANIMVTVSLAKELVGTGVTANTVSPGPILTSGLREMISRMAVEKGWGTDWAEIESNFVKNFNPTLTGKVGRPEDVAAIVAFLASPLADNITASNYRCDGGYLATVN